MGSSGDGSDAAGAGRVHLGPSEKLALAWEILRIYVHARVLLVRKTLPEVLHDLRGGRTLDQAYDPEIFREGVRLGRRMNRLLASLPLDALCLVRSCVLVGLLTRRGIGCTLVIGVKPEPSFEAHAWVECAGVPLLDPAGPEYSRLTEL
jgi:hypothetical protein